MNKISKYGLIIELLTFIVMVILLLFSQQIPDLLMYLFGVGAIIAIAGVLVKLRKNHLH